MGYKEMEKVGVGYVFEMCGGNLKRERDRSCLGGYRIKWYLFFRIGEIEYVFLVYWIDRIYGLCL